MFSSFFKARLSSFTVSSVNRSDLAFRLLSNAHLFLFPLGCWRYCLYTSSTVNRSPPLWQKTTFFWSASCFSSSVPIRKNTLPLTVAIAANATASALIPWSIPLNTNLARRGSTGTFAILWPNSVSFPFAIAPRDFNNSSANSIDSSGGDSTKSNLVISSIPSSINLSTACPRWTLRISGLDPSSIVS